jgi:hypothetical protein
MRLLTFCFFITVVFLACNSNNEISTPKPTETTVPQTKPPLNSATLNASVWGLLTDYFAIKDALIAPNLDSAKLAAKNLASRAANFSVAEIAADSAKTKVKNALTKIAAISSQITQAPADVLVIRKLFANLSDAMHPAFTKGVGYEGTKIYVQHCPMAFEDATANWLSPTEAIINPYMGTNHPKYKDKMYDCGEVTDSIY